MTIHTLPCDRGVLPWPKTFWRRLFEEADYLRSVPEPGVEESRWLERADFDPAAERHADAVIDKYKRLIRDAREKACMRQAN